MANFGHLMQFNADMFSSARSGFKKEFNWTNPWALSSSKMGLAPLSPLMNLPPFFDWDKIPADYHHLRPPLYKNFKFDEDAENRRVAPASLGFSIESLTRKRTHDSAHCNDENKDDENTRDLTEIIKSRGRPSATSLQILKQKSMENPFRFKCAVCSRSFPRKKSLDTHKLIHSDVKPYQCTFPNCNRKFKQSGQLKTHFRLHTGEKPFKCTYPLCETAFTHSNRKCPSHPDYSLQRMPGSKLLQTKKSYANMLGYNMDESYKQKVDAWLKGQLSVRGPLPDGKEKTVLSSIENTTNINLDNNIYEESNKRLLSAVALVELHDQTKTKMESNNQGLLNTLFSITK